MTYRTRLSGILALSLLGAADAWYLAEHAITNTALSCGLPGKLSGCNTVAQSPYSHVLGIPLGVYGVVFYAAVILLVVLAQYRRSAQVSLLLAIAGVIGLLGSLYLLGLQFFVINALCIYCLASFVIAAGIFFLTFPFWRRTPVFAHAPS